jgi:hypothetical protein
MTATINNNTVSMNTQDVLPVMLRLMDPEELAKYNDMTPTCLDYLGNYRDGIAEMPFFLDRVPGQNRNSVIPFYQGATNTIQVNQADAIGTNTRGLAPTMYQSYPNNVLAYDMNRQSQHLIGDPRSRRLIDALYACL